MLCVHTRVHVLTFVDAFVYMCMERLKSPVGVAPQGLSTLFFGTFTGTPGLALQLGCLTSEPQGSVCFCLFGNGIASAYPHTPLFHVVRGIELRSRRLPW